MVHAVSQEQTSMYGLNTYVEHQIPIRGLSVRLVPVRMNSFIKLDHIALDQMQDSDTLIYLVQVFRGTLNVKTY